jgi:hypothetical protein
MTPTLRVAGRSIVWLAPLAMTFFRLGRVLGVPGRGEQGKERTDPVSFLG